MKETKIPKKYALKHFLFVGVLAGFIIEQILVMIINRPIAMSLYGIFEVPLTNPSINIILSISSFVIFLFCVYIGNIFFAKIISPNIISKNQTLRSSLYFGIFVFLLFSITQLLPILNEGMICISTFCLLPKQPVVFDLFLYLFRIIALPIGFSLISRKYFVKVV